MAPSFFWQTRLAFALAGIAVLLLMGLTDLDNVVRFAGLDIILFLIGMMVLIGYLEEHRFFERIVDAIVHWVGPRPVGLSLVLMGLAAVFAALVDEVTSILFMGSTVFHVCTRYRVSPVPLIIMVVFATNIGSTATVVGNPVGVLIALRAELTFLDFLRWATPIAAVSLLVAAPLLLWVLRKPLGELRSAMQTGSTNGTAHPSLIHQLTSREMLLPALLFSGTILALAMHKPIENLLGLSKNSMLLGTAMAAAGIVLLIARSGARELVEKRVEWWTLTFFLLLFASVAALRMTGVTEMLAARLASATGENELALFLTFTWGAGIASAFMDNILAVATLIPVVQDLEQMGVNVFPLWWGLLFGGAFLGNLTMIGSTANIVAIGMMERRGMGQITMTAWLKVAAIPAVLTLAVASAALALQIF